MRTQNGIKCWNYHHHPDLFSLEFNTKVTKEAYILVLNFPLQFSRQLSRVFPGIQ